MEIKSDIKILENEVMRMLLSGEHPMLNILKNQWENSKIEKVDLSGAGFFIKYQVLDNLLIIPNHVDFSFGDVYVDLIGLDDVIGFVLFIKDGRIDTLEGYTTGDIWPDKINIKRIYYLNNKRELEKLPIPR